MTTLYRNAPINSEPLKQESIECLETFDYHLPKELVAQNPLEVRSDARLLIRSTSGVISHENISNLDKLLPKGALLVFNDTRVFAARILFTDEASSSEREIFLLEYPKHCGEFAKAKVLLRPLAKFTVGQTFTIGQNLKAKLKQKFLEPFAHAEIEFLAKPEDVGVWLEKNAYIPLPPYIKRKKAKTAETSLDLLRYQTVFANHIGSVAAPTAALHFSDELLAKLAAAEIERAFITLHVGAGTFLPVKSEDIRLHQMHKEEFLVKRQELIKIKKAKSENRPVIFVGTTSLRCLESLCLMAENSGKDEFEFCDQFLQTELFIRPKALEASYKCKYADALMTNFHQPKSSLFILVCALLGVRETHSMYQEAIAQNYRFFSYGDTSLLCL